MNLKQIIFGVFLLLAGGLLLLSISDFGQGARSDQELGQAQGLIGEDWPLLAADRLTTSGSIYVANLEGQIEALGRQLKKRPNDIQLARLALLYYHRFQIIGDLGDAERARALLGEAWQREHAPDIDIAYARVLLGFHEFAQAERALALAAEAGGYDAAVSELSEGLARIQGKTAPVAGNTEPSSLSLHPVELVGLAADFGSTGQLAAASNYLKAAQDRYRDSSPYTLAWIHVQQGILFLEQEDYPSAQLFFSAAHRRFPEYTLAAEHLAETELALGNFPAAAGIYRNVAKRSGHPEFYHQLSKAERGLGNENAAVEMEKLALERYENLVERYPRMYADHAARYFMDIGDRESAVELASLNLSQRDDPMAEALLAKARECCR